MKVKRCVGCDTALAFENDHPFCSDCWQRETTPLASLDTLTDSQLVTWMYGREQSPKKLTEGRVLRKLESENKQLTADVARMRLEAEEHRFDLKRARLKLADERAGNGMGESEQWLTDEVAGLGEENRTLCDTIERMRMTIDDLWECGE